MQSYFDLPFAGLQRTVLDYAYPVWVTEAAVPTVTTDNSSPNQQKFL